MLKCYLRHRMADRNIDDILELMQLSGVSRNTINKLYRNSEVETIKVETLIRLCKALHCNLSELVEYSPEWWWHIKIKKVWGIFPNLLYFYNTQLAFHMLLNKAHNPVHIPLDDFIAHKQRNHGWERDERAECKLGLALRLFCNHQCNTENSGADRRKQQRQ